MKWITSLLIAVSTGVLAFQTPAQACPSVMMEHPALQRAMQTYFEKLKQSPWEKVFPFDRIEGERIYLSSQFDKLSGHQKKQVLSLLLLDYGEFSPLLKLLKPTEEQTVRQKQGSMLPYWVYTADGRVVSVPYNACNRMTVLTEYERSRLAFLGLKVPRTQRYPMSRWQQEYVKKLFWSSVGYENAGDYWIAWVPEKGHFEVDVPSRNHNQTLEPFWNVAPNYYRYMVVDRGTRLYSYFRGERSQG